MRKPDPRPLKVVQITDLHLGEPGDSMYNSGIDTGKTLDHVLRHIGQTLPEADMMLITGDLAQNPAASTYKTLRDMLATQPMSIHCLAGNHDDPQLLEDILQGPRLDCARVVTRDDWVIVLLDSTVPGETGGNLGEAELELLEEALHRHPASNALVCLHHPVMPVGSQWLDRLGLADGDALFRVLDRHEQVRGVLFGHIHQVFETQRRGVRIMGTPSTCLQFLPGSAHFALDTRPPAYRELTLHPDGRIDSRVVWVDAQSPVLHAASC